MIRGIFIASTFFLIWEICCVFFNLPPFMLPRPSMIFISIYNNWEELLRHTAYTLTEILVSIFIGTVIGITTALIISSSKKLKRWIMPILLASQSIPVFALAPLLILWLGYGMSSKIVIGVLIVFFPITSNFTDALNKVPQKLIDAGKPISEKKRSRSDREIMPLLDWSYSLKVWTTLCIHLSEPIAVGSKRVMGI